MGINIDTSEVMNMEHLIKDMSETRADIKSFGEALGRVEQKVFNGFGSRIDAVNDKLDIEILNHKEDTARMYSAVEKHTAAVHKSAEDTHRFLMGVLISLFIGLLSIIILIWTTGSSTDVRVQALEETVLEYVMEQGKINEANTIKSP